MAACDDEECDGVRHTCWECEGMGLVVDECFEDTCCCADPQNEHDTVFCRTCQGTGGWWCPQHEHAMGE